MSGIDAFGTQLRRYDGSAFVPVANLTSINPPALERETLDLTAHDAAGGWTEHTGGLVDGGEVEAEADYEPEHHDQLAADLDGGPQTWQVVFPDDEGTSWTFRALLTGLEVEAPYDDKLAATLTWKVTGRPGFSGEGPWPSIGLFPALDLYPATGG